MPVAPDVAEEVLAAAGAAEAQGVAALHDAARGPGPPSFRRVWTVDHSEGSTIGAMAAGSPVRRRPA